MPDPLGPTACRVLGCLMEKAVTVPASYPLTLNAVVTACNQSSGRDPIMHLEPRVVDAALDDLRARGLTRKVHASHGARVVKHRHIADEALELDDAEQAVLTVLLLRGPQTPGDLRSRTDRLHPFAGSDEVTATLRGLAARPDPLVVVHDRRPGQKEQRWSHLLDGVPADDAAPAPSGPAPAAPAAPLPPNLAAMAPFVGRWAGTGDGVFPTIQPFGYTTTIEIAAVPGKPFLAWSEVTRHRDDDRPLHRETGFLRSDGEAVELVLAIGSGLVEISEGVVGGGELLLSSVTVAGTSTAKSVTATERSYRVAGPTMTVEVAMAAVGHPLTPHLRSTLTRQP